MILENCSLIGDEMDETQPKVQFVVTETPGRIPHT